MWNCECQKCNNKKENIACFANCIPYNNEATRLFTNFNIYIDSVVIDINFWTTYGRSFVNSVTSDWFSTATCQPSSYNNHPLRDFFRFIHVVEPYCKNSKQEHETANNHVDKKLYAQ